MPTNASVKRNLDLIEKEGAAEKVLVLKVGGKHEVTKAGEYIGKAGTYQLMKTV